MKAVIFWLNPRFDPVWETFETLEEAMETVQRWAVSYPWNTYTVAKCVYTQEQTEQLSNGLGAYRSGGFVDVKFTPHDPS